MGIITRSMALITLLLAGTAVFAQTGKSKPPKEIAPAVQIYFDLNKSKLKKSEIAKLEKLLLDLKSKSEYRILLTGHTDSLGNDAYNLELSASRVDEVYDWLRTAGVDSVVLRKNYYGRSRPREGNADEEKRSKNRRVEITIYEKEKVVPPPAPPVVVKDTCGRDTMVFVGEGVSIKMNICEYTMRCKGNPRGCISVDRLTTLDEIFNNGTPLKTAKGEGFIWGGIINCKFAGDSCLSKPSSISFTVDAEMYKRAKLMALKAKGDNLEPDKATKITTTKSKDKITVTIPVKCSGTAFVASNAGRSKVAKFKDKTGTIANIYVVASDPTIIIPATKVGKFWIVNYKEVEGAKIIVKLNNDDETVISDIDVNSIRKTKKKGELRKKYKVKAKHLK
ncbi:MAG: OmpA family protein [Bacteroidia bacterium]|nr:OmpA family protein [Bacteroidia bacterium]